MASQDKNKLSYQDRLECWLVALIIITYCALVAVGRAAVEGFIALAVWVTKGFIDGVKNGNSKAEERNNKGGNHVS